MDIIQNLSDDLVLNFPNGASLTFAKDGDRLLGISTVSLRGTLLRNASLLWRPYLSTPEGVHYTDFHLSDVIENPDGSVDVVTDAIGRATHLREELDEYLGDVFPLQRESGEVRDPLIWRFAPSSLRLDGYLFDGLSYSYRFQSAAPERKIYRIFDAATWEIGGTLAGNTLLFQGQLNPPVTELAQDTYFTTACNYYGAEMRGILGPEDRISIQRLPRFATIQAFDFMVHERGVLFNYYEPLEDVFSLLQSQQGEDCLHFVDELRGPLSSQFATHRKHILFHPLKSALEKEVSRNLWLRACEMTHEAIRARHEIKRPKVLPRVWTPQVDSDNFHIYDHTVKREKALYYLADRVLPLWAEMGVREICTPSLWVSDYTVDRFKTKEEVGCLQGELTVSGICCVRVHEIDELWGGAEALAYFVEKAHSYDMQVQVWWASHLSRRAPIYAERPDFMLMARDGLPNGGGFGHNLLISMDLNNPDCFEWEYQKLKALREATGVDGFFHDSYGNMTFLPLNYSDETRRGQQDAYERLIARLQKLGMTSFSVEGIGALGTGHFGMHLADTSPEAKGQYQNALDWWIGQEDMLYGLNMGMDQEVWPGREAEARRFAFRCLAGGGRFGFTASEGNVEMWSDWLKELNQLHALLGALTGRRTLLPKGKGVLWEKETGESTLFAFQSFAWPVESATGVCEVTAQGSKPVSVHDVVLAAEAGCVYCW